MSYHYGTAEGIRTPDLLVRSQTLYPAELQPQIIAVLLTASLYYHIRNYFARPFFKFSAGKFP